jgi:hypothetical protein
MPKLSRVQSILLPIWRDSNPGATFVTKLPEVSKRTFPMAVIRRVGGVRNPKRPTLLGRPIIELTVIGQGEFSDTEDLYEDLLEDLFEAVRRQTQTPAGYLHSAVETVGCTDISPLSQDSWWVHGLIQLGIRPPRNI